MKKGKIITLSGISGVGKSFLIKCLVEKTDNFEKLKSVTTRLPRENEKDGIDKYFVSLDEFNESVANDELCIVNEVFGNMYGYYKKDLDKTNDGCNIVTELYYSEVSEFKKLYPNTISIYVIPQDIAVTIENLENRNVTGDELDKRLRDIKNEIAFFKDLDKEVFDYVLINDYSMSTVDEFLQYISSVMNIYVDNTSNLLENFMDIVPHDIQEAVDNFALKDKRSIVYTSFDGDDMNYLDDICLNVINEGKIPLNPEAALGYYVSTVTLGGNKQKVMSDCLTLEMLADELYVYQNKDVDLSEGIIAEMMLWHMLKNKGLSFVSDVKSLDNYFKDMLDNNELLKWLNNQDVMFKQELFHNLLTDYIKGSHDSVYIIANFKNYKHLDWARTYCYANEL